MDPAKEGTVSEIHMLQRTETICFRWLILKDSYLCLLNPATGHIKQLLLFDEGFSMEVTGQKHFKVSNCQ